MRLFKKREPTDAEMLLNEIKELKAELHTLRGLFRELLARTREEINCLRRTVFYLGEQIKADDTKIKRLEKEQVKILGRPSPPPPPEE